MPKGTTKKKAHEKLREVEDQIRRGIYMPDKKIPAFSIVAKDWLEYKKTNVRDSTLKMYKGHLEHHFAKIDPLKVNRITTVTVEKYIKRRQEAGMNLTTLRKLLVTFNQVMNYAVRHRYIDYNPVRDAERPKGRGEIKKRHECILKPDDISAFLKSVNDPKYKTLFMLAIMSGARQGELLGLKWSDIDWANSQLHIQRTYTKRRWYRPKSKSSNRKVDLGPSMIRQLKKWKLAYSLSNLNLIFPNNAGKPMCQSHMLNRHFFPALKMAGLKRIRFHDLRHTYASLLIGQGENIKYIQTQLGHYSPTMTLDVYAHLMKPVNQEAARRLENTVFENHGSNMVAKNKKGIIQ
jgi:integrase